MAKSFVFRVLKNQRGQSAVEYILLLAVLSSIGYTFYNNKKFKDLIRGNDGLFATMRKGMSYSYRYGVEFKNSYPYEEKMGFEYESNKNDTNLVNDKVESRFFAGQNKYPLNQ